MQDIEFTIQEEKLYLLQCRNGKRNAKAGVKIAVDLYHEGIIDKDQDLLLVDPVGINQLLHRQIDPKAEKKTSKQWFKCFTRCSLWYYRFHC